MRKFLTFLCKILIPLGIVLYPIIASFETGLDWAKGGAFAVFIVIWIIWIKKIYKDIQFKEQHERLIDKAVTLATNIKYEISQILKLAVLIMILNILSYFIVDINQLITYISVSYVIGALINIGGSEIEE